MVILLKIKRPQTPAGSFWGVHGWYAFILWDRNILLGPDMVLSPDDARDKYSGGILNSVNGANLVKSVSTTVRITMCTSRCKQVSRACTKTVVEKKNIILCYNSFAKMVNYS